MALSGELIDILRAGGFAFGPLWPDSEALYGQLLSAIPSIPGVYVIVADNRVCYIGKAQKQGIRTRLRKYTGAKTWGSTAETVRAGIKRELNPGSEVRVLFLAPQTAPVWRDR